MFLNNRKKITSCFDGLNIPSYLAYSTFLVITNRDSYGLLRSIRRNEIYCAMLGKKSNCRIKNGKQGAGGVESNKKEVCVRVYGRGGGGGGIIHKL